MMLAPGRRRLGRRPVPPDHARVLQEPAVHVLRLGDSRRPHERHAADGRPATRRCRGPPTRCSSAAWRSPAPAFRSSIGFSGYYSKDAIVAQALVVRTEQRRRLRAAAVSSLPVGRRGDHGVLHVPAVVHDVRRQAARSSRYDHAHESPRVMYVPLVVLAVFAVCVGWTLPGSTNFGVAESARAGAADRHARDDARRAYAELGRARTSTISHATAIMRCRPGSSPSRWPCSASCWRRSSTLWQVLSADKIRQQLAADLQLAVGTSGTSTSCTTRSSSGRCCSSAAFIAKVSIAA